MNGWPEADVLLGPLRNWYETTRGEVQQHAAISDDPLRPSASGPEVGLLRLVEEFTALRQEVKLQTKAGRGVQQQAEALLAGLEQTLQRIQTPESDQPDTGNSDALPWVEALADLDDALWRAETELAQYGPRLIETLAQQLEAAVIDAHERLPAWRRWLVGRLVQAEPASADDLGAAFAPWLQSWSDGYRLLRSRLQRHMQRGGLERISCLGQPLDPHTMTAVQISPEAREAPGTVLAEIRGGYLWQGKVIRYAEVSVAGGNPS